MGNSGAALAVRPMESRDAVAVAELVGELGYQRTAEQVRAWIAGIQDGKGQAAFVAEVNGEVAGWIEVSLERRLQSDAFGLIGGVVVRPGLRGAGIGKRLCEAAERWTIEHGAKKIRVTSRSTREGAHRFYVRDGYEQTKVSMVFEKALEP
ncbi:MAG TPA: GNAT family N-acetyltransferase [Acidobacteriaceae bacterium]|jgi:GNAT superfamily N-acetyltransferase